MQKSIVGIDFGTTNSALAIYKDGRIRIIRANNTDSVEETLRSVLLFERDLELFIGQQAIAQVVDQDVITGRLLQSFKSYLSDPLYVGTTINRQDYSIEDMVAYVLGELKSLGERVFGSSISRAVIGRPVHFSERYDEDQLAEGRLLQAAQMVGFTDVHLELEPIAAMLAYIAQEGQRLNLKEQLVMLGDFGGGTSDFTIMRVSSGILANEEVKRRSVLATNGIYIGGDVFTSRIVWEKVSPLLGRDILTKGSTGRDLPAPVWLYRYACDVRRFHQLREQNALQLLKNMEAGASDRGPFEMFRSIINRNLGVLLFEAVEVAKKRLSVEDHADINFVTDDIYLKVGITRSEFETMIAEPLNEISTCIDETMVRAGLRLDQIDRVILTGGSSFVPCVRALFEDKVGSDKIINLEAFSSVAYGLGVAASFL